MSCEYWIPIIVSIILGVPTLIFAILTYVVNKKSKNIADNMNKRDKDHYNQEVDAKAREFISKYNNSKDPQIELLLLCVIANKFNPIYSYHRQIYIDFNNLSEDVQKRILYIRHLEINFQHSATFYNDMKKKLKDTITNHYSNEIFKIFEPTFVGTTDYIYSSYKNNDKVNFEIEEQIISIFNNKNDIGHNITQIFDNASDVDACAIACETAIQIMRFSVQDDSDFYLDKLLYFDYFSYTTSTKTLEDLFLLTLAAIYLYSEYLNSPLNSEKVEEFLYNK